jgi:S1-C subfamily serine protease
MPAPFLRSVAAWLLGGFVWAAAAAEPAPSIEAQSRALQRASDAVVGVRAIAVEDARSAATLGRARQGSGVVIDRGLVLTIGYLILEAEQALIVTDDARMVPARPLAYDVATGFGLLQPLAPLRIEPAPLGRSAALAVGEPLMIVSGGEDGAVSAAELLARRPFAGYWEYHIEGALFTAPARADHSGAALFNGRGELVGIGSLVVSDALGRDKGRRSGNMFVPIDLLPPILPELQARGSSAQSRRAWIGLNCVETEVGVRVVRVNGDSPAEIAGVEAGDRIVRIDGTDVTALDVLWKALWAGGAPEREVTLEIERGGERQTLKLQAVDRMKTLRSAQGI